MSQRSNRSTYLILILIFIFFMIFLVFASFTSSMLGEKIDLGENAYGESKTSPIGVVEIEGVIIESQKIVGLLLEAEKDDSVKAIILRINSPGGAVGPTQEIYEEVRRIDAIKPIYASFGTVAASGGYYIGAAARKIYSNAGTLTGSIGVIMQFMDLSKLYDFLKIGPKNITAGLYKDIGTPNRPMKEEEEKLLRAMLEDVHGQFVEDIKRNRGDRIVGDIWKHAQGQIYSGTEAKKIGLVDEIGSLWQATRAIKKELKLKDTNSEVHYIREPISRNLWSFFDKLEAISGKLDLFTKNDQAAPQYLFSH